MNAPTRLALFAVGLVAVFVIALGVGAAWGPTLDGPDRERDHDPTSHTEQS